MELSSNQECRGRTVGFPGIWGPAFPSGCLLNITLGPFSRLPPQKALGPSLLQGLESSEDPWATSFSSPISGWAALRASTLLYKAVGAWAAGATWTNMILFQLWSLF